MSLILNIAEKPSVAKSISRILSVNCRIEKGKHKYCPNIFFKYGREMVFTSVLGHLYVSDFEEKKRWDECDPYELFSAQIKSTVTVEMSPVAENIRVLARKCSEVIIWTDCDREGENIAAQIEKLVPSSKCSRARFSGISRIEIVKALEKLAGINYGESEAVNARIELDLRIGSAFTRLQTLACKEDMNGVVSFGPCQIPTLNFVVERFREVESFVSETFYRLENVVEKGGLRCVFRWKRRGVYDKNCAVYFHQMLCEGRCVILEKEENEKTRLRPVPLRTVEMQKTCTRYFKMSGHRLMEVAEKLYNDGYISYPRTETDSFEKGFNFESVVKKLEKDKVVGDYAANLKIKMPRYGNNSDQAHSPIYPLKEGNNLSGEYRNVYDFITRRFLGCLSENAKGKSVSYKMAIYELGNDAGNNNYTTRGVDSRTSDNKGIQTIDNKGRNIVNVKTGERSQRFEEFRCEGLTVTERNYLEIYIYDTWDDSPVPEFNIYECVPNNLELQEGQSEPPGYMTESELIALMDKHGIGTDATIHEHIHKIQVRNYITKQKVHMLPSSLGLNLIDAYNLLGLDVCQPTIRKNLEAKLKMVCQDKENKDEVVRSEIEIYEGIYKKFADGIDLFKKMITRENCTIPVGKKTDSGRKHNNKRGDNTAINNTSENDYRKHNNKRDDNKIGKTRTNFDFHNENISNPRMVLCDCRKEAKLLSVKKKENCGKKFYVCHFFPKKCQYFLWEDASFVIPDKRKTTTEIDLKCDCGSEPAKKLANTEQNRGREFFCCNRNYKKCQFFKWADE